MISLNLFECVYQPYDRCKLSIQARSTRACYRNCRDLLERKIHPMHAYSSPLCVHLTSGTLPLPVQQVEVTTTAAPTLLQQLAVISEAGSPGNTGMFSKPRHHLSCPSAAASTAAGPCSREAYCRLQSCPAIDSAVSRCTSHQWQQQPSVQQQRQMRFPQAAAAAAWQQSVQPSIPEQKEQQRRRKRPPPALLAQREALTKQQQEQRQQNMREADGWFVEQPLGTWSQQPQVPLRLRGQQQQLDMQQPWPDQRDVLDQMQQWQGQAGVGAAGVQGPPVRLVSSSRSFSSFNGRVEGETDVDITVSQ